MAYTMTTEYRRETIKRLKGMIAEYDRRGDVVLRQQTLRTLREIVTKAEWNRMPKYIKGA